MTREEEIKDQESICFDCGSNNDLKVMSEGVALCPQCYAKEMENIEYSEDEHDR